MKKICFGDQDIINGAYSDRIKLISSKWNYYHKFSESVNTYELPTNPKDYDKSSKSPSVIHFVGKVKPWHKESKHIYKAEFWKYARQSPFYEEILDEYFKSEI